MYKILLSTFLLLTCTAQAQRITVQFGSALPGGSFGNNDINKSDNGFATSGHTIGVQADYPAYKNIGITAKLNYNTFGFNQADYQTGLNQNPASATTIAVQDNGGYTATTAMLGGYMTLGKQRFTIDFRLLTGFVTLTDNGLTYTTSYSGQSYSQRTFSQRDATIAFGWGLTARYLFRNHVYVSANLDNSYAPTSFRKNEYQSSTNETVDKPYQAYLMTVGLGYTFE